VAWLSAGLLGTISSWQFIIWFIYTAWNYFKSFFSSGLALKSIIYLLLYAALLFRVGTRCCCQRFAANRRLIVRKFKNCERLFDTTKRTGK
jgi:hypothetical protein